MGETVLANPLGIHCLVWAGDTSRASVERAVKQTAAAGFDLLELSLHDMDNLDVDHARGLLQEAGLQMSCSRGLAFDADVSSTDPTVVERGAKLLQASLATTAALGARSSPAPHTARSASTLGLRPHKVGPTPSPWSSRWPRRRTGWASASVSR